MAGACACSRAEHSPVTTYSLSLKMVGPVPPIQMVGPPPCTGPKAGLVWLKRAAPHRRFRRQPTAENEDGKRIFGFPPNSRHAGAMQSPCMAQLPRCALLIKYRGCMRPGLAHI